MDFSYDKKDELYRKKVKEWIKSAFPDDEPPPRRETDDEKIAAYQSFQKRLHEGGYSGVRYPKEYGGAGGTLIQEVVATEEIIPYAITYGQHVNVVGLHMALSTIFMAGTEAQKKAYLPGILDGTHIWAQAFSEPNAGSDMANISTFAEKQNGEYIINGQKIWSTSAHLADYALTLVRTRDTKPKKHRGLTYLIVDLRSEGITVKPIKQTTGEAEFNEIFFDNVIVPEHNRLGAENDGWKVALGTLMMERGLMSDVGGAAMFHKQFDRLLNMASGLTDKNGPVLDDPLIKSQLADLFIRMKIHKYLGMKSVDGVVKGKPPGPESSINKLLWSKLNFLFTEMAITMQGVTGQLVQNSPHVIDEGQWQLGNLWALGIAIGGGGTEIQKNIIAEYILGLPRS